MLSQCLNGLKVLDLSQYIPGPFATLWLSDMGARVVKVEPPAGDPMRVMGARDADGISPFYKLANRNKQIIRIDLKSEDGKDALRSLLAQADVLVEAYRPGVLARLGFAAAELARINPRLIHCALSGYGQTGPHALAAGHDLTYVALTGGLAVNGTSERPVMTFPPLADHAGAMVAAMSILAALARRGITGKGAHLDVSLSEAALAWMGGALTAERRYGPQRREAGLIDGGAGYYRIYRTRDGRFVALAALEEKFWDKFCAAVERPHWVCRQSEPMPQNALIADLEELFLTRDRDEWVALLAPVDCCFEPVLEPAEVAAHPQWQARRLLQTGTDKDDLTEMLLPVLLNGAPPPPRRPFEDASLEQAAASWR